MFKGKPGKRDKNRRAEFKTYHPGVKVIFNGKGYANSSNLLQWIKTQYSKASAYPLGNHEPRLLSLDAFVPHRNQGRKIPENESAKAMEKRLKDEKLKQQIRDEFAKLNVTLSIIPGGYTSFFCLRHLPPLQRKPSDSLEPRPMREDLQMFLGVVFWLMAVIP